jgi:hypothetical protein
MHQPLTNEDEDEPKDNCTHNSEIEWAMLQVVRAAVNIEDQMENEEIVE